MMRTVSPSLLSFFAAENAFLIADLYTITPQDGSTPLKWCMGDTDLAGFSCVGPIITRGSVRQAPGGETSTISITLGCGHSCTLPDGRRITLAAADGYFDGAKVQIERLFMSTWGDVSRGSVTWFAGTIADVQIASTVVELSVKSGIEILRSLKLPRRLFEASCPYELYGPACGANKMTVIASVVAGSSASAVVVNVGGQWALGTILFTSGPCTGKTRQIVSSSPVTTDMTTLNLGVPLPAAPTAGNAVQILRGCSKTFESCGTFGVSTRWGGFPFVPRPESVR